MTQFSIRIAVAAVLAIAAIVPAAASAAPAAGRTAVMRIEVKESFVCKDQDFCDLIFESPLVNHENAVLYDDGTGHDDWLIRCHAEVPGLCAAGSTIHISEDFRWFAAPAACDEFGCAPLEGDCAPDEFQDCTPVVWRDSPDSMTFVGCAEMSSEFVLSCERRGHPAVTMDDPLEIFGGSYPDNTFWPAVPGHYEFTSPEQWGTWPCEALGYDHCPPPGINIEVQVTDLR